MNIKVLRHIRQLSGYTQTILAEKVGVDRTYITKIESGSVRLQPAMEKKILSVFSDSGFGIQDIALLHNYLKRKDEIHETSNVKSCSGSEIIGTKNIQS